MSFYNLFEYFFKDWGFFGFFTFAWILIVSPSLVNRFAVITDAFPSKARTGAGPAEAPPLLKYGPLMDLGLFCELVKLGLMQRFA